MAKLARGIYEQLIDAELAALLETEPDARAVLSKLEETAEPLAYAQFVAALAQPVFRSLKAAARLELANRLITLLASEKGQEYLAGRQLPQREKNVLLEIGAARATLPRPTTSLSTTVLITGLGGDPPLEHELRSELATADRVDILVSFIKWSGLRLLKSAFEQLAQRAVPVRLLTTSYMGASDPAALEWLAGQSNVQVRVSYDTARTRLHAKAYHFHRESGYSTAYIGSANMSHAAMTQGLEWTVKVTRQDMPHILERFAAEFAAHWASEEFEPYTEPDFARFRSAIAHHQNATAAPMFFADLHPYPYQSRILEALDAARAAGSQRNLVVAATGTGKTVIAALDYRALCAQHGRRLRLLFAVHRKEILQQALACFRTVLRDQNFGELLVDGLYPNDWQHVFASVASLNSREPWATLGAGHFDIVIVDEAHHGRANTYRPLFDHLQPQVLLGLTATPERHDRTSILPDFDHRFAAEVRLPEALEEKLLCPFHYFGVTDSVDLSSDTFWRNGKYDNSALEDVLTGDDIRAKQRLDTVLGALRNYEPELSGTRGVGFCVSVRHARYMAERFNSVGIPAAVLVGELPREQREANLSAFRRGDLTFLFTVDVLSEGVDIPEINLVMFLRPTESLTVFLQQLGRGLRHAPGKDCLTVLDFVGQTHRHYRLDAKFSALLSRNRQRIDKEIEDDFPNLPPGCSIQLERVARETVLRKIREVLANLQVLVPEVIQTWNPRLPLTFGNFIDETGLSPTELLKSRTWSEWKASASHKPPLDDPDLALLRKALPRIALRTDPAMLDVMAGLGRVAEPSPNYSTEQATALHYLFWGRRGSQCGIDGADASLQRLRANPSVLADVIEIAEWRRRRPDALVRTVTLPFPCSLQLHAAYGSAEIKAALGLAGIDEPGPTGVGVLRARSLKAYIHLVTFNKEKGYSPTTRYRDYPINPSLLHWESQAGTTRASVTGQDYIHFRERGLTILFFARVDKYIDGVTAPFVYLGPAKALLSHEGDRPIATVWELAYPMPAALFEAARAV